MIRDGVQPIAVAVGTEAELERRARVAVGLGDGPAVDCLAGVPGTNHGPGCRIERRRAVGGVACARVRPRVEHRGQQAPVTEAEVPAQILPPSLTNCPPRDDSGWDVGPSCCERCGSEHREVN